MTNASTTPAPSTARRAAVLLAVAALAACGKGGSDGAERGSAARQRTEQHEQPPVGLTTASATPTAHGDAARDTFTVTTWKSPTCGCCKAWVEHMEQSGFRVVAIDTSDVDAVKRRHGVRPEHGSCHTATVGGYVLEGHVPAADVRRLLAERPNVTGLAVPGMPQGSPGMETGMKDPYEVLAFTRGGATSVFARH